MKLISIVTTINIIVLSFSSCKKEELNIPQIPEPQITAVTYHPNILRGTLFNDNKSFGIIDRQSFQITKYNGEERIVIQDLETDENGGFIFEYDKSLVGSKVNIEIEKGYNTNKYELTISNILVLEHFTDSFYLNRYAQLNVYLSDKFYSPESEFVYLHSNEVKAFEVTKYRNKILEQFLIPLKNDLNEPCLHVGVTFSTSSDPKNYEKQVSVEKCVFELPLITEVYI